MRFWAVRSALSYVACCCVVFLAMTSAAQGPAPPVGAPYEHSAAGLQAQFAELVHISRSNDQAAFQGALASLGIPNPAEWFAAHFDPQVQSRLTQGYSKALQGYQSHVSWVMVNFAKFSDFAVSVQSSEIPQPLSDSGFESLLPRPLNAVQIENYRLSSASPDPKHGPPSWVSSFVYIDGRFRYVGGTYPFWTEGLNSLRGPMSIPPAVIHGKTVQGIAFRKDQNVPGIDAIVQMKIEVDRNGKVSNIKVISGDPAFVEDAKSYVKAADFAPLPDLPQFAHAKREWDLEVAFFTPKK